jgi:hypothetical protein
MSHSCVWQAGVPRAAGGRGRVAVARRRRRQRARPLLRREQSVYMLSALLCQAYYPLLFHYSIVIYDGRFGVAVGIHVYHARACGRDHRTVKIFVCIRSGSLFVFIKKVHK